MKRIESDRNGFLRKVAFFYMGSAVVIFLLTFYLIDESIKKQRAEMRASILNFATAINSCELASGCKPSSAAEIKYSGEVLDEIFKGKEPQLIQSRSPAGIGSKLLWDKN